MQSLYKSTKRTAVSGIMTPLMNNLENNLERL